MCCYKTHAAQGNELVTEDVVLDCWVLADEPYLRQTTEHLVRRLKFVKLSTRERHASEWRVDTYQEARPSPNAGSVSDQFLKRFLNK